MWFGMDRVDMVPRKFSRGYYAQLRFMHLQRLESIQDFIRIIPGIRAFHRLLFFARKTPTLIGGDSYGKVLLLTKRRTWMDSKPAYLDGVSYGH